jgi:membrane-bound lytic murein transglycosylase D
MIRLQKRRNATLTYTTMRKMNTFLASIILLSGFGAGSVMASGHSRLAKRIQLTPSFLTDGTSGNSGEGSAKAPESSQPEALDTGANIPASGASVPNSAAKSAETDEWLRRADVHLSNGRTYYFQGDLAAARREFDAAVDVLLGAPEALPDHRRIERRLEEVSDLIYRFDIDKLGAGDATDAIVFDKAPIDEISHMTFEVMTPVDTRLAPQVTSELKQTQSGLTLELADPVLTYIHYFSTDRGRSVLLSGLRRAGRYKVLIEKILAEERVPQELIYLAQAESGFLPRAVSNKQAVGMWQFIAGTGSLYDLVRTSAFDERLDPEKATRAAAHHLRDLYERYGDWYLAMAAYNCGAGNVDKAVERTGYADYWELLRRNALPRETANYVPIIIAMTIMGKNPKDYGLESIDEEASVEYESIQMDAPTNLELIADASQQPASVIRDLNPSLLRNLAPAGLQVHVPKGAAETTLAALRSVPVANRDAWRLHHVQLGDTLASVASQYHSAPQRISAANSAADSLEAGELLLVPVSFHDESHAPRGITKKSNRTTVRTAIGSSNSHPAAASAKVSPHAIHRKAVLHTASLHS